jgi:hypothetical protein
MKYAVEMDSGAMTYVTKFHEVWPRHSKVDWGIHRQHGDRISLLLLFSSK